MYLRKVILKHILVRKLRKFVALDVSLGASAFQFFATGLYLLGVGLILPVFFLVLLDNDGLACLESLVLDQLMVDI